MATINLLPWRDQLREERKKEFVSVFFGVMVMAGALVLLFDRHIAANINSQTARNTFITNEIAVLDKKIAEIKKLKDLQDEMVERVNVIEALQGNRPIIVRVFDELVRTLPDGVFYTSVASKGNILTINGLSESNNRVSAVMRKLNESDWFANPSLSKVTQGDEVNAFSLIVKITTPKKKSEPAEDEKEQGT